MSDEFETRAACGTIYYDDGDLEYIIQQLETWRSIKYAVLGKEICPSSGRRHLQYYIEFMYSMPRTCFQRRINNKCFFQARYSTALSSSLYCKKGEQTHDEWDNEHERGPNYGLNADYYEWGEMTRQGRPSVITDFCGKLEAGFSMRQCAKEDPDTFVRFHKGLREFYNLCVVTPRDGAEPPQVHVLYGAAGTGKSRHMHERFDPQDTYFWNAGQGNWFDGYYGQKKVVLEEFRGQIPFAQLLAMLDRYRCKVPVKGSMMEFCADEICICSPTDPRLWYDQLGQSREVEQEGGKDNMLKQLFRRFTNVKDMTAPIVQSMGPWPRQNA